MRPKAPEPDPDDSSLVVHLEHLAADAEDLTAILTRDHRRGRDIGPKTVARAEGLQTSLRAVIHELSHHEPLAMTSNDVWTMLSRQHRERMSGHELT